MLPMPAELVADFAKACRTLLEAVHQRRAAGSWMGSRSQVTVAQRSWGSWVPGPEPSLGLRRSTCVWYRYRLRRCATLTNVTPAASTASYSTACQRERRTHRRGYHGMDDAATCLRQPVAVSQAGRHAPQGRDGRAACLFPQQQPRVGRMVGAELRSRESGWMGRAPEGYLALLRDHRGAGP